MSVRERNFARVAERRNLEANDALDFLFLGNEDRRHSEVCVHALEGGEACSRTYDPLPEHDSGPTPSDWYVGTGIGALYGIGDECSTRRVVGDDGTEYVVSRTLLADLAGWNVVPGGSR